jgi:3-hydroxybutyryl-CoA dehydrogenase
MLSVVVHTSEEKKPELSEAGEKVKFVSSFDEFIHSSADVFIDFLFIKDKKRIQQLKQLKGLVIIDSVVHTLRETDPSFVRVNGWPGLMNEVIEASCLEESKKQTAETAFHLFRKKIQWLPDEAGFITARVISMIINEAYFALEEGISTKEEIDIAMKLGTAYPYGPFEWIEKIGPKKIKELLTRLSTEKTQYKPASLLVKEALTAKD